MKYVITEEDKAAVVQSFVNYAYRIFVLDKEENVVDVINDFTISNFGVDGDSAVRRTLSIVVNKKSNIVQYINTYLKYDFKFQIGVYSLRRNDFIWYEGGLYVPINASTSYGVSENQITFGFGDEFVRLDGTRNGQNGGAPTISIPNKDTDGNFVTLKGTLTNFIKSEGVEKYIIEDLGEFYGIQANNPDAYLEYRKNNPEWDKMPYDLEFNAGSMNAEIIDEIIKLYPNQQAYYDVYGIFCAGMIPSCNNSPIELDNYFFQKVLLADNSESVTYDIQKIKNVTEVFGKIYDIDYTATACFLNGSTYELTVENYGRYEGYVAFTSDRKNGNNPKIKIGNLSEIPICYEYTTIPLDQGTIPAETMSVVRFRRMPDGSYVAYYLGKYQPHAICVLTDNVNDTYYTKEYFIQKYNCNNVILREEQGSPFTVQKIGEVLDVKSGEEYESIISDTVAMQNAIYQNQISSSMNEQISLSTVFLPWLDVQIKIQYKKAQDDEMNSYIIKSISHDIDGKTSSITLQKFYPLYYV